jgi:integrase
LHLERRLRDLVLFNLAIDSKLRGCDLVALRVSDVAPNGYALDRASVRQKKTGRPVRFELTEQTRQSVDKYLHSSGREPAQCLHSFFRYVAFEAPVQSAQTQRVLAIPTKRFTRALVAFLSRKEVDALLAAPDRRT